MSDRQLLLGRRLRVGYRLYFEPVRFAHTRRIDYAARDSWTEIRIIDARSPATDHCLEGGKDTANEYGIELIC